MLGEKIIPDEQGKIVATRILPSAPGEGPKMELTFQSTGTILGRKFNNTGTVVSVPKAEGVMSSQGQGFSTTEKGDMITWTYQGVARPTGPGGAAEYSGCVFFHTNSSELSPLNRMSAVVSAKADDAGNMSAELWEWK